MNTKYKVAMISLAAALVSVSAACSSSSTSSSQDGGAGSDSSTSKTDGGGGQDSATTGDAGPAAIGEAFVDDHNCRNCHGENLGGSTTPRQGTQQYPANLTPDETGLKGWTDAQIIKAVRDGIDDEDQPLCNEMEKYKMTDTEAQGLVAYLKSLAPVAQTVPESTCADGD